MKNYTGYPITIQLVTGARITVPAEPITPTVTIDAATPLGVFGDIEIVVDENRSINWNGINVDLQNQPIIVSREIFDLLPANALEFVTPDLGASAIRSTWGLLFAITKLIAKPESLRFITAHPVILNLRSNNQL